MREEFMITRNGKQFVLFAGLLDEAHAKGLRSIDTELLQVPNENNGQLAVVKARVELEDGRAFSGIGDAAPYNVSRAIAPAVTRMAETRAKARALRDAVNVGATALEELSDGDDVPNGVYPAAAPTGPRPVPSHTAAGGPANGTRSASGSAPRGRRKARKSQVDLIRTLALEIRGPGAVEKMEAHIGKPLTELSGDEASDWIDRLTPPEAGEA